MAKTPQNKSKTKLDFEIKIRPKKWSKEELANVKSFIKAHHAKRTPERKLKNQMLSIKYRMQHYIEDEKLNTAKIISLDSFLNAYLKALNLSFKKFAHYIDTTDKNLKNCISGDHRFSAELAYKFSYFFHTTPELWMKVYIKNQLLCLERDKRKTLKYKKYDYKNVLGVA